MKLNISNNNHNNNRITITDKDGNVVFDKKFLSLSNMELNIEQSLGYTSIPQTEKMSLDMFMKIFINDYVMKWNLRFIPNAALVEAFHRFANANAFNIGKVSDASISSQLREILRKDGQYYYSHSTISNQDLRKIDDLIDDNVPFVEFIRKYYVVHSNKHGMIAWNQSQRARRFKKGGQF